MKVLIISPYFFEPHRWMISGYKTALNLSKGHQVVVLTTGKPAYEKLNPNLKIYRLKDLFLPDPVNFSIVPGLFSKLKKVIKKEKPDIFLVNKNMFYTSLSVLWLKFAGKKVFTQVDTFPGINWFSKNPLVNIVLWVYARTIGLLILKSSYQVILLHEGLIPIASKFGLNYTVIHNGVDLELIKKAKPAPNLAKKGQEKRIVYVGRLESVKGYVDFLEVARKMSRADPRVKFYLVGNTAGKEKIVREYSSDRLIFLGHRTDVFSILKTMDIFVLPSYSEGLPNSLMEAMAVGLPCVASKVGGAKILVKDGFNGLLFSAGSQKAMENKIHTLLSSKKLREKLGTNAHQTIFKSYNWQKILSKYNRLFKGQN